MYRRFSEDPCVILETPLQEKIYGNDTTFKWKELTQLTGDTIPGSDFCIDWYCIKF